MSNTYKHNDRVPTAVLAARLQELAHAVTQGPDALRRECTMRVPAELDRDADLVMCESGRRLLELEQRPAISTAAMLWLFGDDTGASSRTIFAHMIGFTGGGKWIWQSHPSDPADLGRCLRLLRLVPEWSQRISEMAVYGAGWAGLVPEWAALSKIMADEVGIDWDKGRSAPRTYAAMQNAIADGYRADDRYECTFFKDGTLSTCKLREPAESVTP